MTKRCPWCGQNITVLRIKGRGGTAWVFRKHTTTVPDVNSNRRPRPRIRVPCRGSNERV